jgi:tripartite-type tricarboxylate transporter receptor subunit TctC
MQLRSAFVLAASLALACAPVRAANAQDFSGKPIKMIVGLAAGGATDVMARLVAQKMSENMRTTVFVENRPAAISSRRCATSPVLRPTATRCSSSRPAR